MYAAGDIRIEERPLPRLEPGDVLVRTAASGVCSGDLMPWYVARKAPFVFGHEPAGTVVAYGGDEPPHLRDGATLALGDRVFAHHHAPCLACRECAAGRYVHCATWRASALEPGGMAEFFRVPRCNLADTLVLPPALSFVDGSLVEPLACVVKSLSRAFPGELGTTARPERSESVRFRAGALAGRTLYVIGAGVMGLMHVAVASALGAIVYASDFHSTRRAEARRLGASDAYAPDDARAGLGRATDERLAHAVICGPGSSAALEHAVETTAADGTLVMFTPLEPGTRFAFDQTGAYFRDLKIVASYSCGPDDTRDALALLARGVVDAARLNVTECRFPDVQAAYRLMQNAACSKAVVVFKA